MVSNSTDAVQQTQSDHPELKRFRQRGSLTPGH
jgi:transketolase